MGSRAESTEGPRAEEHFVFSWDGLAGLREEPEACLVLELLQMTLLEFRYCRKGGVHRLPMLWTGFRVLTNCRFLGFDC